MNQQPNAVAIHVPPDMPADQVEMLAETRIRKWLLDPTFPTPDGRTFCDTHGIQGLFISYWGPSGKHVYITQGDASSLAAKHKSERWSA
jgi:hypothetical protein